MSFFYPIGIFIFRCLIRLAALFNAKAALRVAGLRKWKRKMKDTLPEKKAERFWFHCASLGEFEMALPVIHAVQAAGKEVVISFFSSSGYSQKSDFKCQGVFYLPDDSAGQVRNWYNMLQPDVVIFVKYEFWLNFMKEGLKRNCEMFVISGNFRTDQFIFKIFGLTWRNLLKRFNRIFVQNIYSLELLKIYKFKNAEMAGDTRFDRVLENIKHVPVNEKINAFCEGKKILIAGSSWPEEEKMIRDYMEKNGLPEDWKLIIAPHDIGLAHVANLQELFKDASILFSQLKEGESKKVLVIDNIGMLSGLYAIADIAIVGGAFGNGLHNILEAAAFGMPIIFGPRHAKFPEAQEAIDAGFAFSVSDIESFEKQLEACIQNDALRQVAASNARNYVQKKSGATRIVLAEIV